MTENSPPSPAPSRAPIFAAAAFLVLAAGAGYLGWRVHALESSTADRLEKIAAHHEGVEKVLNLIRLEAKHGIAGIGAVIEQIEHWAPELASSGANAALIKTSQDQIRSAIAAAEALDPETAFPALEAAFTANEDPETRRWFMHAMMRVDKQRGLDFCAVVVRGNRYQPRSNTRFRAADELLDNDKMFAGEVLAEVLQIESARGITRPIPVDRQKEYEEHVRTSEFPSFFNFINQFARSEHPEVEPVLVSLINRDDHDMNTYRECIKELGKLKSKQAAKRIKRLIVDPPFKFVDPIFTMHALQALVDIEGESARPFLEELLAKRQPELVANKLDTLIKGL